MSDHPREGEAQIPFLARSGRFVECMILAWQEVEDKVDQMTVQEFGLLYVPDKRDPRVEKLVLGKYPTERQAGRTSTGNKTVELRRRRGLSDKQSL